MALLDPENVLDRTLLTVAETETGSRTAPGSVSTPESVSISERRGRGVEAFVVNNDRTRAMRLSEDSTFALP